MQRRRKEGGRRWPDGWGRAAVREGRGQLGRREAEWAEREWAGGGEEGGKRSGMG